MGLINNPFCPLSQKKCRCSFTNRETKKQIIRRACIESKQDKENNIFVMKCRMLHFREADSHHIQNFDGVLNTSGGFVMMGITV
jgi:hypothetical protein